MTSHKANCPSKFLDLERNKIGDAGASALADALEATLVMCCLMRCAHHVAFGHDGGSDASDALTLSSGFRVVEV